MFAIQMTTQEKSRMEDKKQAAFIYCLFWVMFFPVLKKWYWNKKSGLWSSSAARDNEVSMFHDLLNLRLNF